MLSRQQQTGVLETIEPPWLPLTAIEQYIAKALAESWQNPLPGEFDGPRF
jgi:hypothetical protein